MKHKTLVAFLPVFLFATGCSMFSASEPPAPTAKKVVPKISAQKKPATPVAPIAKNPPGTATYAIDTAPSKFKAESSMPTFQAQSMMPPVETPSNPQAAAAADIANATVPAAANPPAAAAANSVMPVASAPQPMQIAMEDAAVPAGTSPAVVALISQSDRDRNHGDLDGAVVVMERALRIDSRNPTLTYKLAQLRLKQSKPQLAEELAGKAALLAGNNLDLKRKSWLLIAEARQQQHNLHGAKEAKLKADSFFGH